MTIKSHLATLAHYPSLLVSSTAKTALMEIDRMEAENARLREALIRTTASLVAAKSLLEHGGKKAAASGKMFVQMLAGYQRSVEHARAAIKEN